MASLLLAGSGENARVATLAPPAEPLPETRLRVSAVLTWPRLQPFAAEVADSVWQNSHRYDELASGSIYFLSRDPLVTLTRSPYAYVGGNPLNARDPSGLENPGEADGPVGYPIEGEGPVDFPGEPVIQEQEQQTQQVLEGRANGQDAEQNAAFYEEQAADSCAQQTAQAQIRDLYTTPAGRILSWHYLDETGPVRNIPGSVVDNTIDYGQVANDLPDRTVYYDSANDVTVVVSKTTGRVMSARRGTP